MKTLVVSNLFYVFNQSKPDSFILTRKHLLNPIKTESLLETPKISILTEENLRLSV
jgi:hypothetical protein